MSYLVAAMSATVSNTNINIKPSREGLESHQLWIWLAGANPPHWEVVGTGALFDEGIKMSLNIPVGYDQHVYRSAGGNLIIGEPGGQIVIQRADVYEFVRALETLGIVDTYEPDDDYES